MGNERGNNAAAAGGKAGVSLLGAAAVSLIVSVVSSVGAVYIYHEKYSPKFLTMDVVGYLNEQRDLYLAGKLTDDDLKKRLDSMKNAIEQPPGRYVVLSGEAVLRGAEKIEIGK